MTIKMSNYLFWRFQYRQRFALLNRDPNWSDVATQASSWHDKDVGEINTLRYVCHAMLSKLTFCHCTYDINKIPKELMPTYVQFFKISYDHEYLLTDLLDIQEPGLLLKNILDGKMPLPPRHFHIHNGSEAVFANDLIANLYNVEYFPLGTKETNEKIDIVYKLTAAEILREELSAIENVDDQKQREKLYKLYNQTKNRKLNLNHTNLGERITSQGIFKIIKMHNSAHHTTFKEKNKSHEHRAIGLFLWDHKNIYKTKSHEIDVKIDEILSTSDKYTEGQPEERKRAKLLNHANTCIQERNVLALTRN